MNNFYEKGLFAPILNKKKYRVMKITVAILTFALFHVAAIASYAQSAKVNLNVTNISVKEVLQKIEKISEYTFFYNDQTMDLGRKVSINARNKDITDIIFEILPNFTYRIENKKIILIPRSNHPDQPKQRKTISGVITDETGEPLIGASVQVKGKANGTITDYEGKFSLNVDNKDILEVSYNHILSTQHPKHGGYVYFTPARPRHYRNYSAPNEAMWCCVGTGMENHGKYGQFIYTHVGDALFVNLYAASQLDWKKRGITLRQETTFPYSENSTLTITEGKGAFNLMVRYPEWVHPGEFKVSVNGQSVDVITGPSSYVSINRKWKKGDVVNISFPMHASLRYLPNEPQYVAFMYGPILLGMKTGTESMTSLIADDSRFGQYAGGPKLPIDKAPILINNDIANIPSQLTPVPGKPLHFTLSTRMENKIEGELQPFFEIHDSRYMMYWLALTEGSYKQYIDNIAKQEQERQALEASTVDKVQPGEQQPETDHKMETDESYTGNTNNIFYRDARNGHYFSYLMQTSGLTDLKLRLKYWGVGEWKTHEFDIYIDNVLLCSVNNTGKYRISEFKAETYDIPAALLQGKEQVRVKFVAKPNRQIGEIYEVRLVKPRAMI